MASLPEKFKIAQATMIDQQAYISSRTRSLIARQRKLTGQAFDFRLRSTAIDVKDFKGVMAGLSAIQRDNATVQISIPVYSESDASNKIAFAPVTRGDYEVTVVEAEGVQVGDFFNFAGHGKAYQVTSITGDLIQFAPNLVQDVAEDEVLTFDGMQFSFYMQGRPQQYDISGNDNIMEIEVDFVERW